VQLHTFLTWALDGGELSVRRHCCCTSGERADGTRCTEGCVGPGAGLNALGKSDLLSPTRILQSSSPIFQSLITLTFKSQTCFSYQLNAQFLYSTIIYYIIVLDMFRAILCSSSGGQIVLLQHLVSSLYSAPVKSGVHSQSVHCTAAYRE
jgi:hypothetical protein